MKTVANNTLFGFGLLLIIMITASCSQAPKTAQEILDRSINEHDPSGQWSTFNEELTLKSQSVFSDNKAEMIRLSIAVADDKLCYSNERRAVDCCFEKNTISNSRKNNDCDGYTWTKNFYTYVWGLPMKINDPGTLLEPDFSESNFNGTICYAIKKNYEKERWTYFINKNDYTLEGFKFVSTADSTKGEIVINSGIEQIGDILSPKVRTWYDLDMKLLGTDTLIIQ